MYVYRLTQVKVAVKDSLGKNMSGVTVQLSGSSSRAVTTDSSGLADFGRMRDIYQIIATVNYTAGDGSVKSVTSGRFDVGREDVTKTLTIPVEQYVNIVVKGPNGEPVDNATVMAGSNTLTAVGNGTYGALVTRTAANNETLPVTITAPGYKSKTGTVSLGNAYDTSPRAWAFQLDGYETLVIRDGIQL